MEEILYNLNKEQIKAVVNTDGAMLVLAGAGTGKTRVLTSKIAYIIKSNLAYTSQILAVTFTNKAANEMKNRVMQITNLDVNSMWINTFHSIAARILRSHSELISIKNDFLIIDQSEQVSIIKRILKDLNIDNNVYPAKYYVEIISKFKDKIINNVDYLDMFNDVYNRYNEILKSNNMCDFSDLINYNIDIFTKFEDIKKFYNDKFKYVLVDEYQDTNKIQNLWLKLICSENVNITCVGDDDQSIYGWRGAEIKNILNFEKDFKNPVIVKLEKNYRSTQNILDTAYSIISNNKNRHNKKLYSNISEYNDKVTLIKCNDIREEAENILNEIQKFKLTKYINNYKDCVILVRAGYQTRIFEDIFLKNCIPYIIIGGLKFYERKEIKDCIAYLRLINNTSDNLAFERIINVPKRGIGQATIEKIRNISNEKNITMFDASVLMIKDSKTKISDEISNFISNINMFKSFNGKLKDLMSFVLNSIGYIEFMEKDSETKNKIDNIEEFLNTLKDFKNIKEFLEYVSLVNDNSEKNIVDAVNIMTIHAAKGLEFDVVFLPNWQEGVFPSPKSLEEINGIEEERRLAYVSITRAKKKLYITNSAYKYDYDNLVNIEPSIFINELPQENIEIIDNVRFIGNNFGNKFSNTFNSTFNNKFDNEFSDKFSYNSNKYLINEKHLYKQNYKKCLHNKFGYGKIIKEDGDKLTINFENFGQKIILKSFVQILD